MTLVRRRLQTFTNEGLIFDVIDEGPLDGPVIVALHGFPQRSKSWRAMIPSLIEAGFRVLAPNQRGYSPGARPKGVMNYATSRLKGDVLALADQAGAARFHVLGHDWGAALAWELADEHPDRVLTVTALSVPHPRAFFAAWPRGQIFRSWYMLVSQLPWLPEKLWLLEFRATRIVEKLGNRGNGWVGRRSARLMNRPMINGSTAALALWREPGAATAIINWYRAMFRRTRAAGIVHVPALYVWGTGDRYIGRAAAELTARYAKGPYRFEILEGVSHWIPEERPVEVAALVVGHIRRHSGRTDTMDARNTLQRNNSEPAARYR